MLAIVLAAAAVSQAPSLDLELYCPGQYADTETTTADVSKDFDVLDSSSATVTRQVMRNGAITVSLHGAEGQLTYPDGRTRALEDITADERRITAQYKRRALMRSVTWRLDINRLTGDVRVASGSTVAFLGTCSAAPTRPKF